MINAKQGKLHGGGLVFVLVNVLVCVVKVLVVNEKLGK